MSDTPQPHWNYSTSDGRYSNSRALASSSEHEEATSGPLSSSSTRDPPRFFFSGSQGIDPAVVPTAADFRFNLAAQPWNSGTEQRYGINSSHAGSMSQLNVRRSGHPRGADQKDNPTPINAEPLPQIRVRRSGQPRNAENFHLPHYGSSSRGHGRSSIGSGAYTNEAGSR